MTLSPSGSALGPPRWRGQPGRLEVWYLTATDSSTETGIWIHQETVAPTPSGDPYSHGWTAVFEPSAPPSFSRFGPSPAERSSDGSWHSVDGCSFADGRVSGSSEGLGWDLTLEDTTEPLYTFPRAAWHRELLPGAQVVPGPAAKVRGPIEVDGRRIQFDGRGGLARINGHGSARRWAWLHADLHGEGVLEIVSGTATRAGLRRLPPMAFVQLRLDGSADWPGNSLVAAPRFRTNIHDDGFSVRGRHRGRDLDVQVTIPDGSRVDVEYTDPDGDKATCRNSERATAIVTTSKGGASRTWNLESTAHAEIGTRDRPGPVL